MDKVHVIYGSTTGMTEAVAEKIAKALDAQAFNINAGDAAAFDAELLVLGSSTWTLATAAKDAGATLVGEVLKLDDTNEADQTDSKIAAWVETLKAAL